jgi:hypothetical protein
LDGLQTSVLSRWPDGSARFVLVAGRQTAAAAGSVTLDLRVGKAPVGAALGLANLRATGITAEIRAGSYGTAVWTADDWSSPERTWVTGPLMSSWLYRKPLVAGGHLTAWLEVRLWSTGDVEVLPWVENGYILRPDAVNKAGEYAFVLGGSTRFSRTLDLPNRCRTVLLEGDRLAWWLRDDWSVSATHDPAYLMATRAVPHYPTPLDASTLASWPQAFTPLEQGLFPPGMGAGGYHPSIGLLPNWDAAYLTAGAFEALWKQVQWQGYRAGRYGIHFRDENTERPPRLSQWATAVFGAGAGIGDVGATTGPHATTGTGTVPSTYKVSHHPSMGFLAAVLTGRCYHVETCQFLAAINALHQSPQYRGEGAGALSTTSFMQVRGFAWGLRTLAQALVVTPQDDPLALEFTDQVSATVRLNHQRYVAQPNHPQGVMKSNLPGLGDYTPAADPFIAAPWMLDFCTAAVGYLRHCTRDIGADQTRLVQWFDWISRSVVGRFGGAAADEYLFRDAGTYLMAVAPSDASNWDTGVGPWYANWGQIWAATVEPGTVKELGDGTLRGGYIGSVGSYWSNLTPGLAYAVEHAAPGAAAAWQRFSSAPNFVSGVVDPLRKSPEWGVLPRSS